MIVIGDVHGKTGQYLHLLKNLPKDEVTFQIGDMGLGFKGVGLPPPGTQLPEGKHFFIRGNHDAPKKCQDHPWYAGEYGYWGLHKLFFHGGAWSIDRDMRIEDVSWWRDEELSYEQLDKAIELYEKSKPEFVVSHECPEKTNKVLLYDLIGPYFLEKQGCGNTRTSSALQQMLDIHAPKIWVFGHYHIDKEFYVPGYDTKFVCINELSTYNLET